MGKREDNAAYKSHKEVELSLSGQVHLLVTGTMLHSKSDHHLTIVFVFDLEGVKSMDYLFVVADTETTLQA